MRSQISTLCYRGEQESISGCTTKGYQNSDLNPTHVNVSPRHVTRVYTSEKHPWDRRASRGEQKCGTIENDLDAVIDI